MIEKILERLREKSNEWFERWAESGSEDEYADGRNDSFDEAIQIVQEVAKEYGTVSDNDLMVIEALPSLYPLRSFEEEAIHKVVASAKDGGWIPCSERLPEENGRFLVTDEDGILAVCRFVADENEFRVCWDNEYFLDAIAWQPLPAPYQKGE